MNKRGGRRIRKGQGGFALIAVLGLAIILALFCASVLINIANHYRTVSYVINRTAASYLAEAGIYYLVYVLRDEYDPVLYPNPPEGFPEHSGPAGNDTYTYNITWALEPFDVDIALRINGPIFDVGDDYHYDVRSDVTFTSGVAGSAISSAKRLSADIAVKDGESKVNVEDWEWEEIL